MSILYGEKVDEVVFNHLKVRVGLATVDQNNGKARPFLMRNAYQMVGGNEVSRDKVVVCEAGSYIVFEIRSRGPRGFGVVLRNDKEVIEDNSYSISLDQPNREGMVWVDRYNSTKQGIQVINRKDLGEEEWKASWQVTIASFPLTAFTKDGKRYDMNGPWERTGRAMSEVEVNSGGVRPGDNFGPQGGGTIGNLTENRADQTMLEVKFFVAASQQVIARDVKANLSLLPVD